MATQERLKKFLEDVASKENYALPRIDIKPISSEGANYTAELYLATISEPLKPDINIFAKSAVLGEEVRTNNDFLAKVYETEAAFYSELAGHFEKIYDKHQVPASDRLTVPKYYGHLLVPYEEILVLENLVARGFNSFNRFKTYNWEYAAASVTQLARFHAVGLALREDNPLEFESITNNFDFDMSKDQEMMQGFMQTAIQTASECLNDEHKKRLLSYFSTGTLAKTMQQLMEVKTMLIHGDFRPSNLMHRRRNGKLEVITLDYQTLRLGSPALDLMYFIFSGSDAEFRRLHFQRLVDHYFLQLTLALRQLGIDVETVYPRKTFDANLIEMRPLGLIMGIMMATTVTVAPEDAPTISGDITSMQVKPNELAQQRIRGIVADFVTWGLL